MWNGPVVADLKRLHSELFSSSQIADRLNARHGTSFSRNAIIGKLHRLGIKVNGTAPRKRKPREVVKTEKKPMILSFKPAEKKAKQPKPLPKPISVKNAVPVSLLELEHHHCRYVVSGENEEVKFCGATKKCGSSYCPTHHNVCHTKERHSV